MAKIKKSVKKKKKGLTCATCSDKIEDRKCLLCDKKLSVGDEVWCCDKGHFCSSDCVARFYGDETYAEYGDLK